MYVCQVISLWADSAECAGQDRASSVTAAETRTHGEGEVSLTLSGSAARRRLIGSLNHTTYRHGAKMCKRASDPRVHRETRQYLIWFGR